MACSILIFLLFALQSNYFSTKRKTGKRVENPQLTLGFVMEWIVSQFTWPCLMTDRQTDGWSGGPTGRQTDRHIDGTAIG